MKTPCLATACAAAFLAVLPAVHATEATVPPCPAAVPADACQIASDAVFRPESDVRTLVERFLRYRVDRVETKGSCYAVLASDRGGTPFVVTFRGSDLRMVSRYPAKDMQ